MCVIADPPFRDREFKSRPAVARISGLYIRVSTEMQTEGNSLTTQETGLRRYTAHHECIVTRVLIEAGLENEQSGRDNHSNT